MNSSFTLVEHYFELNRKALDYTAEIYFLAWFRDLRYKLIISEQCPKELHQNSTEEKRHGEQAKGPHDAVPLGQNLASKRNFTGKIYYLFLNF